jgi:hypothetical protein
LFDRVIHVSGDSASDDHAPGCRGRKNLLFVNKKKQKNFIRLQAWRPGGWRTEGKFFASFFQKRRFFLTSSLA